MDSEIIRNYILVRSGDTKREVTFICRNCGEKLPYKKDDNYYITGHNDNGTIWIKIPPIDEVLSFHLMECDKYQEKINK